MFSILISITLIQTHQTMAKSKRKYVFIDRHE